MLEFGGVESVWVALCTNALMAKERGMQHKAMMLVTITNHDFIEAITAHSDEYIPPEHYVGEIQVPFISAHRYTRRRKLVALENSLTTDSERIKN